MVRRVSSALLLLWALGFVWFAIALPRGAPADRTDAAVVFTGGAGRVERGLEVLNRGWSKRLLLSGVDPEVKPAEIAKLYHIPPARMACCVQLEFSAVDTRTNGAEAAAWIRDNHFHSVRLITSDWHMRRSADELRRTVPKGTIVVRDAVYSKPSFHILFLEYNKLLARWVSKLWGG